MDEFRRNPHERASIQYWGVAGVPRMAADVRCQVKISAMRRTLALVVCAVSFCAAALAVIAQDAPPADAVDPSKSDRVALADAPALERQTLEQMLAADDWAFRALGLMRLDRYLAPEITDWLTAALSDSAWQVRCFAIRHAWRANMSIDPTLFAEEGDARVIRALLQHGNAVDPLIVNQLTEDLLKTRTVDALLMGIEIGASATDEDVREHAAERALHLVRNMNAQVGAVVSRRLAMALRLDPAPQNLQQWRAWLSAVPREVRLPATQPPTRHADLSAIASADAETFTRLRDYLGVLRQRDLEMVLAIDATNSMMPMIDQVKADVDALILFLSDVSSTMRLGLLAYRDTDNPGKLVEGHPLSTDLESLRKFLFGLQTPGGATYPESVLAGLHACREFEWSREAEREIIIIGDAPPHDSEKSEVRALLEWFREQGVTVHAVHVPMEWPPGFVEQLNPNVAAEREQWRAEYNLGTQQVFQEMANFGGGQLVELNLDSQNDLVCSVMKLTIEPEWWAYFDEFYDGYLELCR